MNTITLSITAGSGKELLQIVRELASAPEKMLAANGAEQPNSNGATKNDLKPVKKIDAPEVKADVKAAPADNDPAAKDNGSYTVEAVRKAAQEKSKQHKDTIKAMLTEFGASNLTELAKENYGAFMEKLAAL